MDLRPPRDPVPADEDPSPFDDPARRMELLDKLNALPGISLPPDAIERRPGLKLRWMAEAGEGGAVGERFRGGR